jgi:hypothetical protein
MHRRFVRANAADGISNFSPTALKAARNLLPPLFWATIVDVVTRSLREQIPRLCGNRGRRRSLRPWRTTIPGQLHEATAPLWQALHPRGCHFVEKGTSSKMLGTAAILYLIVEQGRGSKCLGGLDSCGSARSRPTVLAQPASVAHSRQIRPDAHARCRPDHARAYG